MGLARMKRSILISIQAARWNKTHWMDEYNSDASIYNICCCFDQLYKAGIINTRKWWEDGIEVI